MMSNNTSNNQPHRRSSRRQSQQKAKDNTTSTTAANEAAAARVVVPSESQKKEKNKKSAFRDGKHPETGLRTRHCSCPNSTRCRERAWLYSAMGNEDMLCYLNIPKFPAQPNTDAGRHTIKFRNCLARHLLGRHNSDGLPNEWNKSEQISIQHFPPEFRGVLRNMASGKVNMWRVDKDVGRDICTNVDLCEDERHYFAAPTLRDTAIENELKEAQRVHAIEVGKGAIAAATIQAGSFGNITSMLKTPKPKSASTTQSSADGDRPIAAVSATPVNRTRPRMSPTAKEHADLVKELQNDPHKFAQKFIEMQRENAKLKDLTNNLEKQKEKDKAEYDKKVQQLCEDFECMAKTNGLNRKSLLSNEYHKKYYWMSSFLFGMDWDEHKSFVEAAFHQHDVDINVTGEERRITNFEAINICTMLTRRGYCRGTLAGMYERTSLSSISYVTSKWMPILGKVGASMSHLSLELNHSFYSEEECKKYGLPYMGKDGNVIDYTKKD